MSAFAAIQAVVITLVVGYSAVQAFRKLMPATSKRLFGRLSAALDQPSHGALRRRLGRWLQPSEAKSGGCGSGDGCGSCGGCAPAPVVPHARDADVMPLHFRPRGH